MSYYTNILLLILLPAFIQAQQDQWINVEEEDFEEFSLALKILHHPTLADDEWIKVEFNNKTGDPFKIEKASYVVKCVATDKNDQIVKEGSFSSNNPSEFFDDITEDIIFDNVLHPGISNISHYPSAYGASILRMPKVGHYNVDASISLSLKLTNQQNFNIEWEDIHFEFSWFRPSSDAISSIEDKLRNTLESPSFNSYHHHTLFSLLSIDEIGSTISLEELLTAKDKRYDFSDGRTAIVRYLNSNYAKDKASKEHYLNSINNKDFIALTDLQEATNIWDDKMLDPLMEWYTNASPGVMIRIAEVLHARMDKIKNQEVVSRQLSDHLLEKYSDILYSTPEELSQQDLMMWASLSSILGKTGDATAIGIICPFLQSKKQLLSRDIQIDPSSEAVPSPVRVCDIALETILHLQHKNIDQVYRKSGFKPPYIYGEIEIVIERIRNNMINDMIQVSTCSLERE